MEIKPKYRTCIKHNILVECNYFHYSNRRNFQNHNFFCQHLLREKTAYVLHRDKIVTFYFIMSICRIKMNV